MSNLEQRLDSLESTVQRLERKIDRLLEMFGLEPSEEPEVKAEAAPPIDRYTLADVAADYPEAQAETVPVKQGWSEPPNVDENDPESVQALREWLSAIDASRLSQSEVQKYIQMQAQCSLFESLVRNRQSAVSAKEEERIQQRQRQDTDATIKQSIMAAFRGLEGT